MHIIFAVKHRNAIIKKDWQTQIFAVIGNLINESGGKTIIVNGMEDHVHCLIGLKPSISVSDVMQNVKAKSSKYIDDRSLTPNRFEWQEGYGVFSYGQSQIESVYKYIQEQKEHHKKQSFRDEYVALLQKFRVEYDD